DGEGGGGPAEDHQQCQQQARPIGACEAEDELAAALAQAARDVVRDLVDVLGGHAAPGVALLLGEVSSPLGREVAHGSHQLAAPFSTASASWASSWRYRVWVRISSEWVPTATIRPPSSGATRSARASVEGRCATRIAVAPASTLRRAASI